MEEYAKAKVVGTIANDLKLTPGGMLVMKVLVTRTTETGKTFKAYIPIMWWREKAAAIVNGLRHGDPVEVVADVGMNVREGEYPQVQLSGVKVKKIRIEAAAVVQQVKEQFDAQELPTGYEDVDDLF